MASGPAAGTASTSTGAPATTASPSAWACRPSRACSWSTARAPDRRNGKAAGCYEGAMRIATWNVNSLRARLEKVTWWLERARPDVLLMQETKLADTDVPTLAFRSAGYEVAHHGEGRWNGVAIASRCGIADVVANFGAPLRPAT